MMYKTDDIAVDTPMTNQYQSGNSNGVFAGSKIFTESPVKVNGSDMIKLATQIITIPERLIKKVLHHWEFTNNAERRKACDNPFFSKMRITIANESVLAKYIPGTKQRMNPRIEITKIIKLVPIASSPFEKR